jgi:predicted SprT family Zn-dependent metalloprotease
VESAVLQLQFTFREGEAARGRPAGVCRGTDAALSSRAGSICFSFGLEALSRRVKVRWNGRMRSTAGRATWPDGLIELNPALEEISAGEVERTFLHELAHLIAYERSANRRVRPHGREWRRACCDLGIPGERAGHSLPLPSRTIPRKWRYFCPACWAVIERVRRMRGHSACYTCCLAHNRGDYDERFRLVEKRIGAR